MAVDVEFNHTFGNHSDVRPWPRYQHTESTINVASQSISSRVNLASASADGEVIRPTLSHCWRNLAISACCAVATAAADASIAAISFRDCASAASASERAFSAAESFALMSDCLALRSATSSASRLTSAACLERDGFGCVRAGSATTPVRTPQMTARSATARGSMPE